MGTHARIGIFYHEDRGFIRSNSIYCSWDGYPYGCGAGVGVKLLNHYDTTQKVEDLITRGNISSLEETIETTIFQSKFIVLNDRVYHANLEAIPKYTYHRSEFDELFDESWNYLWNPSMNAWFVKGHPKWVMMTKTNIKQLDNL